MIPSNMAPISALPLSMQAMQGARLRLAAEMLGLVVMDAAPQQPALAHAAFTALQGVLECAAYCPPDRRET